MPIGNALATFEMKSTSMTKGTDAAGNHTFVMNMEGTVSGGWTGTVLATMTAATADFKAGTYTVDAAAYLTDGAVLTGCGSGVFSALGGHKWRLNGVDLISDGTRIATEGDLALATRSYTGKLFSVT